MKVLKIMICMIFLFANIAGAKVYLLVDKDTQEIRSLSPSDDAQLESGQEKVVLDVDIEDIELAEHPVYYKYKNSRFVLNTTKISDEELANTEAFEKKTERDEIMEYLIEKGQTEMEAEGKVFKHKN